MSVVRRQTRLRKEYLYRKSLEGKEKSAYERKLMAMTAEGRSSAMILALLPPAFTLLIFIGDRKYLSQLTNSSMGHSILIIAGVMYLLGVVWVRRLVNPKG
jgi:tight adherence protein B